jgi:hypothetical protein
MRTASQNGKRSRTKGARWELEVAKRLAELFPNAKRSFQARSGKEGCDVEHTPFWVECKHGKLVNLRGAIKQAIEDSDGRTPVVVAKDDRSEPLVVMRFEDFLKLVGSKDAQG